MLDELEAVELRVSEVLEDNQLFRLEAEFFQKRYLANYKKFKFNPTLSENSKRILCGPFGSAMLDETYKESGIKVIRPFNIKSLTIENDNIVFIDYLDITEKNLKTFTKNTIFFSRVGDIKCGIYTEDTLVTISPNIIAVEVNEENYNPYFLTLFFNTKYGFLQIERELKISAQPTVSTERLQNLKLPILDKRFQDNIGVLFNKAISKVIKSEKIYKEAEEILLKELDLLDFKPSQNSIAIKSFSESFLATGRLDSEYYQPKYDDLEEKILKFQKIKLNKLVKYSISSGATPKAGGDAYTDKENGVPFIRAVNVIGSKVEFDDALFIKNEIHNQKLKKTKLKKNDVLFSIAGTVGRCGISYYENEANINQAVAILRFDDDIIRRLYLILFFNSDIGKLYITKYSRQGLQTNLNLDELGNLEIPIIEYSIQTKIETKIKTSFKLKSESKELLALAKKAVEVAIEEGEKVALEMLR